MRTDMMENQVTTVETSKQLIGMGVPSIKASLWWERVHGSLDWGLKFNDDLQLDDSVETIPAFTTYELMTLLPSYIEDEGMTLEMSCFRYGESWAVSYYSQEHNYGLTYICYDLIGALYLAVAGLVNKGYKLNL